jgi:tetratricopeptide (TPR) repeat protein
VDGLFQGTYEEDRKAWLTNDWRREVKNLESAGDSTSVEVVPRLDYAWALHMAGQNPKSIGIYQAILKSNPGNYETLCSYATVLHEMKQYPQAAAELKKAIALKPDFRHRAEEFHLEMIQFLQSSQKNFKYAEEHVFLDALTPFWKNRKGVDQNFSTIDFPDGYTSEGVAELIRQFPRWGEGWFVLGMMLEHEKDFSMAAKAYDRALERGTAHAEELRRYMATFRPFGRSQDPGRLAGRRFVQLLIGLVALFIFYKIFQVAARVINDISGARAMKAEDARRKRMRNKDPDSPL